MSQKKSAAHIVNSDDANVALRQSEQEFDALVSGVEDYAIFLLSPEGHVISWNAGAQRIKGYKPEEIIGKHFSVFYTQEATERDWPGAVLPRLFKNCIICWNYLYLSQKLAEIDDPAKREELLQAMAHGSAAAWARLNLLGEYDFSKDKLQDSVGIKPPKLTD